MSHYPLIKTYFKGCKNCGDTTYLTDDPWRAKPRPFCSKKCRKAYGGKS